MINHKVKSRAVKILLQEISTSKKKNHMSHENPKPNLQYPSNQNSNRKKTVKTKVIIKSRHQRTDKYQMTLNEVKPSAYYNCNLSLVGTCNKITHCIDTRAPLFRATMKKKEYIFNCAFDGNKRLMF